MKQPKSRSVALFNDNISYLTTASILCTPLFFACFFDAFKSESDLKGVKFDTLFLIRTVVPTAILDIVIVKEIRNPWKRQLGKYIYGYFVIPFASIWTQMLSWGHKYHPVNATINLLIFSFMTKIASWAYLKPHSNTHSKCYGRREKLIFLFFLIAPTLLWIYLLPWQTALYAWMIHAYYNIFTGWCMTEMWLILSGNYWIQWQ